MLPAVPHITFGIFNLAIPNIIAWGSIALIFAIALWVRIPNLFKPGPEREESRE
jgi:hypothetical protein